MKAIVTMKTTMHQRKAFNLVALLLANGFQYSQPSRTLRRDPRSNLLSCLLHV
jgi:hypothetical protein